MNSNYQKRIDGILERLWGRSRSVIEDGLLLACLRPICGRFVCLWARVTYVPILRVLEVPTRSIARLIRATSSDEDIYLLAIDTHKGLMTVAGLLTYFAAWWLAQGRGWQGPVISAFVIVFVVGRLTELISVFGLLFFSYPPVSPRPSFRPLVNAFWTYLEVTVLFAALYCVVATLSDDAFSTPGQESLCQSVSGPLHFSLATIATVGYGDFSPRSGLARSLAACEIMIGMFLIVAIIQKALSRTPSWPSALSPAEHEQVAEL
jgi:hypothetical protein